MKANPDVWGSEIRLA